MADINAFRHGPHFDGGHTTWNVWTPLAESVELVLLGDGSDSLTPMQQQDKWWTYTEPGNQQGRRYRFRLNCRIELPDPASRSQPDGVHGPSEVFIPAEFAWHDHAWRGVELADLTIYELHVGTFTPEETFDAVVGRLDTLADLGITCLEIMPVAQFPGRRGWGYDGVYPFAVQQSYGGPRGLQRLVDACHARGIAVLLDVVYNHLGPEGNYFSQFGPYFTAAHHTPWGPAWNYDDAGSEAVRSFVLENVQYWLRDFHLDGLRLDAVHAICDNGPEHILRAIQRVAEEESRRCGSPKHIMAETNTNDVKHIAAPAEGGEGLAAIWSDDFHHAVHSLLTGEREGYYADYGDPQHLTKAINDTFVFDGCFCPRRGRTHGAPAAKHSGEHFVVGIQNHDQVGNRARGDRFGTLLSPPQQKLAAALMLLSPFTPLLFMGEEYGETRPFPFFCDFSDKALIEAVRHGRRAEFAHFPWPDEIPDPQAAQTFDAAILTWQWNDVSWQAGLRRWYRDILSARHMLAGLRERKLRRAYWHPAPEARRGILELRRGAEQREEGIAVFFNVRGNPSRLPSGVHGNQRLLYSTAWPRYSADDEPIRGECEAWNGELHPWEVVVFGR